MVTGQDPHAVTAPDAHREQLVGHRVRRGVELPERQLALVVDHRGTLGMPTRVERRDHPDLAPGADVTEHGQDVLRGLQP